MVFPGVMYGYESWIIKMAEWQRINAFELEKTFNSPLDSKEIKPVNPKGNQPWIFIGRTDAEVEAPILWPPDAKNRLIGKDPDAGKDWGQEEKGVAEDEMVEWHHWLNKHGFEQTARRWWRTGKPGVLQSMGLQRVGYEREQPNHSGEGPYTLARCIIYKGITKELGDTMATRPRMVFPTIMYQRESMWKGSWKLSQFSLFLYSHSTVWWINEPVSRILKSVKRSLLLKHFKNT